MKLVGAYPFEDSDEPKDFRKTIQVCHFFFIWHQVSLCTLLNLRHVIIGPCTEFSVFSVQSQTCSNIWRVLRGDIKFFCCRSCYSYYPTPFHWTSIYCFPIGPVLSFSPLLLFIWSQKCVCILCTNSWSLEFSYKISGSAFLLYQFTYQVSLLYNFSSVIYLILTTTLMKVQNYFP